LVVTLGAVLAAAVLRNVFVRGEAQQWIRSRGWPRLMASYPVLLAAGTVYHLLKDRHIRTPP